jgi:hypothetical protein
MMTEGDVGAIGLEYSDLLRGQVVCELEDFATGDDQRSPERSRCTSTHDVRSRRQRSGNETGSRSNRRHPSMREILMDKPNPGSDEAIAAGCTCPVLDNSHDRGKGPFTLTEGCPIHDPRRASRYRAMHALASRDMVWRWQTTNQARRRPTGPRCVASLGPAVTLTSV